MPVTPATTPPPAALGSAPWSLPRFGVQHALVASALAIAAWVALAAWSNDSQLQDSLEQFVWGQSLQWGYWKHPPLTSWLMWAMLRVAGPVPWAAYALGGLLTFAAVACTTRFAQLLAGDRVAVLTALLLALHYGFTRRAQMFNHNTVLVACMAFAALAAVQAVRANRLRDWLLVGLAAGLALLAKYQAIVPLAGLLLALVLAGEGRRCARGIALATACAAAVMLPHGVWALQHGGQTLHYALASLDGGAAQATHRLRLVPVLAMQAKYFLTIGVFALLLAGAFRAFGIARAPWQSGLTALQRRWFAGLVLLPVAVLVGAAAAGVQVQSHWGFQASQFLVVPIAIALHRTFGDWRPLHTAAWLLATAVAMAVFLLEASAPTPAGERPPVSRLPAAAIANEVTAQWRGSTTCPLRYVRGPVALAGIVAAYAGQRVQVQEDGDLLKTPWIDQDAMRAHGFVDIREQRAETVTGFETLVRLPGATPVEFVLEVHPPQQPCEGAPAQG